MFTVQFAKTSGTPKYEQLYRRIRQGIASGEFPQESRLPSKRRLAAHLSVSLNTVENAYAQLLAEGFITTLEKKGYFVLASAGARQPDAGGSPRRPKRDKPERRDKQAKTTRYVLRNNAVDTESFPFATWSRLMRDSLRQDHAALVQELHPQGDRQLREEIAAYLWEYRNMRVEAEQIVVGAGTTYLLGMITELLPAEKFVIEDPGYFMLARTLRSRNVRFEAIPVDGEGLRVEALRRARASVCVVTPANQFPLCLVMSIARRWQLLEWAGEKPSRFIVEDDYDSDYRYALRPAPSLYSLDRHGRVIYFNTFARTLTPSLRIAYMVLPPRLLAAYTPRRQLYSCTVSGFEQRTLLRFIRGGHYERHLNRMRTVYKRRRNAFMEGLAPLEPVVEIAGADAGLHLLLRSRTGMAESVMAERAKGKNVAVFGLSGFFHNPTGETHTVVAGYGGLKEAALRQAAAQLAKAWL